MATQYNHELVDSTSVGYISHVDLPSGNTIKRYEIHDPNAVHSAADLGLTGAMHFLGVSTTAIEDNSIIDEILIGAKLVTVQTGDVALYNGYEYVWVGDRWEQLGQEGSFSLKDHNHQVTITPKGGVSAPNFTGTE